MCKNVRYADVESAIPCRSVPLSQNPFLSLLVHVLYILISRQRYRAVLLGSHVDRRSIRFGTRAHPQIRTYAHIYVHSHTCSCFHPSPSHCRRYPRVLQRNSANHSRTYSDACHNERRATFCFGPVGRKYRPFWIFNFQRSSKPLRAPPPLSSSLSPLALPLARVLPPVGCCCRRTPPPPPPLGRVHVALVYERAPSALVHYMVGHIVVFGEISSHFGRYLCMRGSGRGVSFH